MPQQAMQPPILSFAERDRRWARVRELMRERGFAGMLVAGFRAREAYETYISDDYNEGCVIFPLEGDPVVITWAYLAIACVGTWRSANTAKAGSLRIVAKVVVALLAVWFLFILTNKNGIVAMLRGTWQPGSYLQHNAR